MKSELKELRDFALSQAKETTESVESLRITALTQSNAIETMRIDVNAKVAEMSRAVAEEQQAIKQTASALQVCLFVG